jgi:hypothetical protein
MAAIERLWRWLKQEVLHLQPFAANWKNLKRGIRSFLERFTDGSDALLSHAGVSVSQSHKVTKNKTSLKSKKRPYNL